MHMLGKNDQEGVMNPFVPGVALGMVQCYSYMLHVEPMKQVFQGVVKNSTPLSLTMTYEAKWCGTICFKRFSATFSADLSGVGKHSGHKVSQSTTCRIYLFPAKDSR